MIDDLKPYPKMKDSGVPWLGEVPAHWTTLPLKRWVRINRSVLPESTPPDYEFRYLDIGSVGTGVLTARPQRMRFAAAPFRARRVVRDGDTIVSTVRTYLKAVYYVDSDSDELVCSTGFAVLTPPTGTVPKFVSYLCQSTAFTDRVTADSVGIAYPAIAETRLGAFHVAVPPLPEQAAIVRFLDHADRRIRRYIRAKQKLIKLLEEQKQVIIHRAVTRGLDPNVRLKPSGVEWLGDVPEHWEVVPFKRRIGFQEGPGIMAADFRDAGVPLLRISCLRGPIASLDGCNFLDPEMVKRRWSHFAVQAGDYLLSASASTGGVALATEDVAGAIPYTGILRLWSVSDRAFMPFVRLYMGCRAFQDQIDAAKSGVAIEHFGPTHLKRMWIALPPRDEQRKVVEFVESELRAFHTTVSAAAREIDLLREYRTRLIADVVTGKLDVREAAARLPDEAEEPEPLDEAEVESETQETDAGDADEVSEETEA